MEQRSAKGALIKMFGCPFLRITQPLLVGTKFKNCAPLPCLTLFLHTTSPSFSTQLNTVFHCRVLEKSFAKMEQMQILTKRPIQKPSRSVITIVITALVVSITLFHFFVTSTTPISYGPVLLPLLPPQHLYLQRLTCLQSPSRWESYPHNPVLPDEAHSEEMGTMFDLSVLYEDGVYKMYGSWRPNGSVSYSTSHDGFVWDQNLRGSLGGEGAHHWEPIVIRPFVLKRATGEYLMWYGSLEKEGGE